MPGPGYYWIGKEEEEELLDLIRARYLFRYGDPKDPAFKHRVKTLEEEVARKFGVKHALAVSSGTSALITAMAAAGIGPGDEVIVPGYTFIASMSSVIFNNAVPDPGRGGRKPDPGPGGRGGADHPAHPGDPAGAHDRQPLRPGPPGGDRQEAQAAAHRGRGPGLRRLLPRPAPGHDRRSWAPTPSTSSRPSTPATGAWWSPTTTDLYREGLRLPRPGAPAPAHGRGGGPALGHRAELPHERAVRGGAGGPVPQAGRAHRVGSPR